jgi:hypothetical protein
MPFTTDNWKPVVLGFVESLLASSSIILFKMSCYWIVFGASTVELTFVRISTFVTSVEFFDQISYTSQNPHFSPQVSITLYLISQ